MELESKEQKSMELHEKFNNFRENLEKRRM